MILRSKVQKKQDTLHFECKIYLRPPPLHVRIWWNVFFLQTNKCTFTTRGAAPPLGYRFPPAGAVNYHRNQCQLKMRRSYTWGRVCIPEINHTDLLGKFSLYFILWLADFYITDLWPDSDRICACSKTQIGHVLLCAQVSSIALPIPPHTSPLPEFWPPPRPLVPSISVNPPNWTTRAVLQPGSKQFNLERQQFLLWGREQKKICSCCIWGYELFLLINHT